MKNLTPVGEMVLLGFYKVSDDMFKVSKGGILMPNRDEVSASKTRYEARVVSVGEKVDLSTVNWKVGDKVVFNDMDVMKLQDEDDNIFGITKVQSIWAKYE